ncbi:hypothetical protein B0H11DRAFT_2265151 [Mycena galericulata]|nr:hypothetical protein B0H11DRAFT_2265151 [Mycena galericulata]
MHSPYDTPPDASKMTREQIRAYNRRVAAWVYNDKNREERNEKNRLRMARLRAAEAERPAEEREARRQLASPPPGFVPCEIPLYLGPNWHDHVEFSGWGNRTYWVLLLGGKQGVYSLKVTCIAAIEGAYKPSDVIEGFQRWEQVLAAWAKHCYHRHAKCRQHPAACSRNPCAAHVEPVPSPARKSVIRVKTEGRAIKKEDAAPVIKQSPAAKVKNESPTAVRKAESPTPLSVARGTSVPGATRRAPPPRYTPTPVPETDSERDTPPGGVPLFDPDSSDDMMDGGAGGPPSSPTPVTRRRRDSVIEAPASRVRPLEEIRRDYVAPTRRLKAATSPLMLSAESSTSMSTAASTPAAGRKEGKRREMESASMAQAGPSRLTAAASWDDPFYVAGGTIHHSSKEAFEDVSSGPVRVVMGWEASTRVAREAVQGGASTRDSGPAMDL